MVKGSLLIEVYHVGSADLGLPWCEKKTAN